MDNIYLKKYPLFIDFSDNNSTNPKIVGGKISNLATLWKSNFPVLNGQVLTTYMSDYLLNYIPSQSRISHNFINKNENKYFEEIRKTILNIKSPDTLSTAIKRIYSGTKRPIIIRSSATTEDGNNYSFAGIFKSFLGINTYKEIESSIKSILASIYDCSVINYCKINNIFHNKIKMSILIQQMVSPDVSGVCFTKNPINGDDQLKIESTWGFCDLLVGGEVIPDNFTVNSSGRIISKIIGSKKVMNKYLNGKLVQMQTSKDYQEKYSLTENQIISLFNLSKKIEKYFNRPQDIEWSFCKNQLIIFQTRPITSNNF